MTIKAKLRLIFLLILVQGATVSSLFIVEDDQMYSLARQEDATVALMEGINELNILFTDAVVRKSPRARLQLMGSYGRLRERALLAGKVLSKRQQERLAAIRRELAKFRLLLESLETGPLAANSLDNELVRNRLNYFLSASLNINSAAQALFNDIQHQRLKAARRTQYLTLGALLFLGIFIITPAFFLFRELIGTLKRFASLAGEIQAGELDKRFKAEGRGELAGLAQAFNSMLARLDEALVAKESLEEEVRERIHAQELLQRSTEIIQGIMDHAPFSIFVKDREGEYLLVNRWGIEQLGAPREEWSQDDLNRPFSQPQIEAAAAEDRQVVETAEPLAVERTLRLDGVLRHFSVKKFPILDMDGEVLAIGGFADDITGRKAMEHGLRGQVLLGERLNKALSVEETAEALVEAAMETGEVEAAAAYLLERSGDCYRLVTDRGVSPDISERYLIITSTDQEYELAQKGKSRYDTPEEFGLSDPELLRQDGIRYQGSIPLSESETTIGVLCVATRTSTCFSEHTRTTLENLAAMTSETMLRIQAKDALVESEVRYRTIFTNSVDGISVYRVDPEIGRRILLECNASYARQAGRSMEEMYLLRNEIWKLQRNDQNQEDSRLMREKLARGEPFGGEFSWIRPDGAENTIEFQAVPAMVKDQMLVFGIDRDVTAQKKLQRDLRNLARRTLVIQEEERRRIGRELHDAIAQNLAALRIHLQVEVDRLRRMRVPVSSRMDTIMDSAKDMLSEVRSILSDLRPAVLEDMGLNSSLNYLGEELNTSYPFMDFTILIGVNDRELPDYVEHGIYRLIQEGVNNAVKHSRGSRVVVELAKTDGHASLRIEDDGTGFEPVDDMHKGYGLAGMRERAELLGGRMDIRTGMDSGTRIVVTIPVEALQ